MHTMKKDARVATRLWLVAALVGSVLFASLPAGAGQVELKSTGRQLPEAADGPAVFRPRLDASGSTLPGADESGARLHARDCFTDPADDVTEEGSGAPATFPAADLTGYCVDYAETLQFELEVDAPTDPFADTNWALDTAAIWFVDADGDGTEDFVVQLTRFGDEVAADVFDAVTDAVACSATPDFVDGTYVVSDVPAECIGTPAEIGVAAQIFYQDGDGGPVYRDDAPDDASFDGPIAGDAPPPPAFQCPGPVNAIDPAEPAEGEIVLARIACGDGDGTTQPIEQAIAISEVLYGSDEARHAIIARDDEFADALAGSGLSFGVAPILYTHSPASVPPGGDPNVLAPKTEAELDRVLEPGDEVMLLGGTAALAPGLDAYIEGLGYDVRRFAGASRFATAAEVAREVRTIVDEFEQLIDFPDLNSVMVATGRNWVDAVAAGQLAAYWGFPVVLTERNEQTGQSSLPAETAQILDELNPNFIYYVGGQAVIDEPTAFAIGEYAKGGQCPSFSRQEGGQAPASCRLTGRNRFDTAFTVGQLNRLLLKTAGGTGVTPQDAVFAVSVNLDQPRESNAWTHVLSSAPLVGAQAALYLSVAGPDGSRLPDETVTLICGFVPNLDTIFIAGDRDLIADSSGQQMRALLQQNGCPQ